MLLHSTHLVPSYTKGTIALERQEVAALVLAAVPAT